MFLTTSSFLVTTPGVWEASAGGFPALSALPGQFVIKDLALLGIAFWTLGEAWKASQQWEPVRYTVSFGLDPNPMGRPCSMWREKPCDESSL